tara:strand:- start:352 stop:786 length:435 start_codon:yes stop_codon:yes gene_type:complete
MMRKLDKKIIKEISELMDELKLSELGYSDGKNSYNLKKKGFNVEYSSNTKTIEKLTNEEKKNLEPNLDKSVKAPLVGTVYLSPEPGSKPFVELDQTVKVGQVLLIIEAMKTMNEITSNKNGKVKKIFVRNAEPVEFGEPLILIE